MCRSRGWQLRTCETGADPMSVTSNEPNRRNVNEKLLRAVAKGDLGSVKKQLRNGADANPRNRSGETPLLRAAYRKDGFLLAAQLLDAGADPNLADNDGNTPLIVSASDEKLNLVRRLVS